VNKYFARNKDIDAGLHDSFFSCVNRSDNSIAHFLIKFVKYIFNDVTWMENLSPPA